MPGKGAFKRCVESVASKGSATDPRAVCAVAGRKKYGPKKFAAMAKAGKKRAAAKRAHKRNVSGMTRNERALIQAGKRLALAHAAPTAVLLGNPKPSSVRKRSTALKYASQHERKARFHREMYRKAYAAGQDRWYLELQRQWAEEEEQLARQFKDRAQELEHKDKRNPNGDPAAAKAYKDFHGREADRISKFRTVHHFPKYTAALGDLQELKIRIPKGRVERGRIVDLSNFDGAWLTRHPRLKQLYVEGGDQSLDLAEFGLDPKDERERVYLGELIRCVYFTRKDHLGADGGTANYHHRFGKNELTLEKTELIQVSYHVPDEQLEFSGGTFEIPAEGIDG